MSPTSTTLHMAAVDALLGVLPTPSRLRAEPCSGAALAGRLGAAVVASFVGATSADLAVVLADPASLDAAGGQESSLVSRQDVLRPALENAAAVLGVGVLGDTRVEDATALVSDANTVVYELTGDGAVTGWFAIRLRDNGPAGQNGRAFQSVVGKLGRINSVEMALTVEIGRTRMSVRDVLALEPGAVIELDRSAGAPADILLNGRLIAHGEIVVVDQDYAVRITQILDVAESLT
ncbi:flagellar motor switch protein FliN [Cryobacterium sp. TMT2-23]|uniref:flagellar motor switch protein FliN n=1 Tax=Cryobacterium sp. TMT2-23 TaxID=1259252 RepID=UPI00106BBA3D|nr:flagellar motor switch protein FliN [Cryobacterium sp. TMT2-23]TFD16241.1 flagellar motor switch protein FliN [Cryobacterium sp. TMT2-23]